MLIFGAWNLQSFILTFPRALNQRLRKDPLGFPQLSPVIAAAYSEAHPVLLLPGPGRWWPTSPAPPGTGAAHLAIGFAKGAANVPWLRGFGLTPGLVENWGAIEIRSQIDRLASQVDSYTLRYID